MKTDFSFPKKHIFLISVFLLLSSVFQFFSGCAGNPSSEGKKLSEPENSSDGRISSIPVSRRSQNYFSGIDESVLNDVELASPLTLRRALSSLRKPDSEYKENEKVLIFIAASIMNIVWTSEKTDFDAPSLSGETSYSGAVSSVRRGLYDTSTGKVDYLSTLLPALVVARENNVSSFFEDAEKDLVSCLQVHRDSVLVNYLLGLLYKKNGEYEKSENYLSFAFENSAGNLECSFEYADLLNILGKSEESYSISRNLLEKYPRDVNVLNLNAKNAFSLENYSSAEEYIARILQQNPNDLGALLFRISILVEKKDYIHAASLLDVYSREDSSSRNYLYLRAKVQYEWSKNTPAAISTVENALSMYPDDEELQLFAARLASASKMRVSGKSAEEIAGRILEKNPSNYDALQYAVEGLVEKGEWQKAYSQSSVLVSRPDASNETVFLHIRICLAVGRNDEAWNLIYPVYRSNPSDENVVQAYITVLHATGRTSQALALINELLPNASGRMKSLLYYRRSLLMSREEDILSDLRSSLIANPRNSDSLFRLYEIYNNKADYRKAQYYLKQVVALNPNDSKMRALNDELTLKLSNSGR